MAFQNASDVRFRLAVENKLHTHLSAVLVVGNAGKFRNLNRLGVGRGGGLNFFDTVFQPVNAGRRIAQLPRQERRTVAPLFHPGLNHGLFARANALTALHCAELAEMLIDDDHVFVLLLFVLQLLIQSCKHFRVAARDRCVECIAADALQQLSSLIVVGEIRLPSICLPFLLLHREIGAADNQDARTPCPNLVLPVDCKGQRPLVLIKHPIHPVALCGGLAAGLCLLCNLPRIGDLLLIVRRGLARNVVPERAHLVGLAGHLFVDFVPHCLGSFLHLGEEKLPDVLLRNLQQLADGFNLAAAPFCMAAHLPGKRGRLHAKCFGNLLVAVSALAENAPQRKIRNVAVAAHRGRCRGYAFSHDL